MNTILVTTGGPLECRGQLEIVAADGKALAQESETRLCRCGHSRNKPYCDGSHRTADFRDDGAPEVAPPATLPGSVGVLRIVLRANGPLRLEGRCEVIHPALGLIFAGEQTALCRCGESKTKPFCDGSHRQAGFSA